VLFSSLALALLFWQWRPLTQPIWTVTGVWAQVLWAVFWLGWGLVLLSTFLINHFDLFGLKQVWDYRSRRETPPSDFKTPWFYKAVRHPIYLGFILAFWAAPTMTAGRLMFALATTAYILIGIQLEERDLIAAFGERYVLYRRRVSMLFPLPRIDRNP
jgi:protein-S-isoprenylcysteine O-methyltransferase Ste14